MFTCHSFRTHRRLFESMLLAGAFHCSMLHAQVAVPIVELSFSETNGLTTTNSGSLGGAATFAQAQGLPVFAAQVPIGAFATSNNRRQRRTDFIIPLV
jgi:hypothetical protein